MKVIVKIIEKLESEAHIEIPDGLSESAIKQHITDLYNSGQMLIDLNIFQINFESMSAQVINPQLSEETSND